MDTQKTSCSCGPKWGIAMMIIPIALIVLVLFHFYAFMNIRSHIIGADDVDESTLQAVFLSDGQVYFGKITETDARNITLEEVYYLQQDQDLQAGEAESTQAPATASNLSLVKLGNSELHLPKDKMVINRDQVLFWENLKDESPVVKAVNNYSDEK
jgi:hypothetical protein